MTCPATNSRHITPTQPPITRPRIFGMRRANTRGGMGKAQTYFTRPPFPSKTPFRIHPFYGEGGGVNVIYRPIPVSEADLCYVALNHCRRLLAWQRGGAEKTISCLSGVLINSEESSWIHGQCRLAVV
ncbi:hypothetical protein CDAR_375731 [Caerostris darwini]|uniref:Uncharacterized protein n=1 Tax=Caerostris darwini TaxID=1538125 RepID=A0AAV4S419_9ARAC|nr:hypothetical protein CDAR_375731 [Caerostris darwini]